ncbi:HipA domain-containing protein [Chitinophaga horti]|uniref:HipA domain-containing protein n=1 Tax=Chitinophaga horti TaxID=2920382 RepID=A0ABY6IXM9_9BACT|nr:HipA domain-containing protein [Chitinophaga horti]UYQ92142.1 HipA domain-containing protein [Chitinophaga horti]
MIEACPGCYKPQKRFHYCSICRRELFDGVKVPPILFFNPPTVEEIKWFHRQQIRVAMPGKRPKYSLMLEDDELALTRENVKGLFIMKLPPVSQPQNYDLLYNEHLTMQLARVFDIETAHIAMLYFANHSPALLIRRFDVEADGNGHLQESLLQVSNGLLDPNTVSYEDIGLLIKKYVAAYKPALQSFFQRVIFNHLFSNNNAGLSSFSIMRTAYGDYKLSPAYSLRCSELNTADVDDKPIRLYNEVEKASRPSSRHRPLDFIILAKKLGILENRAKMIIESMTSQDEAVEMLVRKSFLSKELKNKYLDLFLNRQDELKKELHNI